MNDMADALDEEPRDGTASSIAFVPLDTETVSERDYLRDTHSIGMPLADVVLSEPSMAWQAQRVTNKRTPTVLTLSVDLRTLNSLVTPLVLETKITRP